MIDFAGKKGNLVEAPKLTNGGTDKAFASFTLACINIHKKVGEKYEPDFFPCKAFKKQAEYAAKLSKGQPVMVFGEIHIDKWKDTEGTNHQRAVFYVTDIFAGAPRTGTENATLSNGAGVNAPANDEEFYGYNPGDDEDLPF